MRAIKTSQWSSELELEGIISRCHDIEFAREREISRDCLPRGNDNLQSKSQNDRRSSEIWAEINEESRIIIHDLMDKCNGNDELKPMNLRNVNRRSLKEKVKKVNIALHYFHIVDITERNGLILGAAIVVQEGLGLKGKEKNQKEL